MTEDNESGLKLYGCWRSSCSHRVVLALRYYGLDFDYIPIDLGAREQETETYLEVSPAAQVPALVYQGEVITQSMAIISLIDSLGNRASSSLFPEDPVKRALAISVAERVSTFIQPFMLPGGIRRGMKSSMAPDDSDFDAKLTRFAMTTLDSNLSLLNDQIASSNGPLAMGDAPSLADVFVFPQLVGAARLNVDLSSYPSLQTLFDAMSRLDWVEAANPMAMIDAPKG
jgi:maleylacetoacetate isomerase